MEMQELTIKVPMPPAGMEWRARIASKYYPGSPFKVLVEAFPECEDVEDADKPAYCFQCGKAESRCKCSEQYCECLRSNGLMQYAERYAAKVQWLKEGWACTNVHCLKPINPIWTWSPGDPLPKELPERCEVELREPGAWVPVDEYTSQLSRWKECRYRWSILDNLDLEFEEAEPAKCPICGAKTSSETAGKVLSRRCSKCHWSSSVVGEFPASRAERWLYPGEATEWAILLQLQNEVDKTNRRVKALESIAGLGAMNESAKVLARVSEIQENRKGAVARFGERGYPCEWVSAERYKELKEASRRPASGLLRGDNPSAALLSITRHDGDEPVSAYVIRTEDLLGKSLLQMVEEALQMALEQPDE